VKDPEYELLEAAYRLDVDPETWQRRLTMAVWRRFPSLPGVLSYEFDCSLPEAPVLVGRRGYLGGIDHYAEHTEAAHGAMPGKQCQPILRRGSHAATLRGRLREEGLDWERLPSVYRLRHRLGYRDLWAVCAVLPGARGLAFASPMYDEEPGPHRDFAAGSRLARHVAAAARARETLIPRYAACGDCESGARGTPRVSEASAVFTTDGNCGYLADELHGETELRDALSRAVITTERARSAAGARSRVDAHHMWELLLSGGWSLVHHSDTDGKRLLLAVKTDKGSDAAGDDLTGCGAAPEGPPTGGADLRRPASGPGLSNREREVIERASLGAANKEIASDLAISLSTVATHLTNALAKLGLGSRRELISLRRALRHQVSVGRSA
jgi:DNA-binding CsgD family transcriptional regulator